ncbi:cell division protein FtsB [Colwellia sp. 20A7]|jgi:cell division protein FtsB|uniref:cell division protein FtsB n=1 Tax=Colwellia sp. 20A7 TaxID=2689569 RepID=UPI00135C96D3|nr:cell division protein FtsB [Colwellia sp. 20A7]
MRAFTVLLFIVLALLQYRLWFGKNSVSDYLSLQEDVKAQQLVNAKLQQRNKLLYADTDDLKLGTEAIEERARNELGMIKENETFFRVVPSKNSEVNDNTNKELY